MAREHHLREVAERIIEGRVPEAIAMLDRMLGDRQAAGEDTDALKAMKRLLEDTRAVNEMIIGTFRAQFGQMINVTLKTGAQLVKVGEITGDKVQLRIPLNVGREAYRTLDVGVNDLALMERYQRLGSDESAAAALVKGMMACEAGSFDTAARFFQGTRCLLADDLAEGARRRASR